MRSLRLLALSGACLAALPHFGAAQFYRLSVTASPGPGGSLCGSNSSSYALARARPVGDLDNDGYADVFINAVAAAYDGCGVGEQNFIPAVVVSGRTHGTLLAFRGSAETFLRFGFTLGTEGEYPLADVFAVGDLDGDGDDDIAHRVGGTITFGSNTFGAHTWVVSGSALDLFGREVSAAGDVDLDGRDDVLIQSQKVNGALPGQTVLRSGLDGSIIRTYAGGAAASVGDVDNDGHPDHVIGHRPIGFAAGHLTLYSGRTGAILWTFPEPAAGREFGRYVRPAGDVNADGTLDVITVDLWTARVHSGVDGRPLLGLPCGSLFSHPGTQYPANAAGDLDSDGHADIFVDGVAYSGASASPLGINGNFGVGDTNRDGIDDYVALTWSGSTPRADIEVRSGIGPNHPSVEWTRGFGCQNGAGGIARIGHTGSATHGDTLIVKLWGAAPNATAALHIGTPLSLGLAQLGAPGCALFSAPFLAAPATTTLDGRASLSLPLTAAALPLNVRFDLQWAILDPSANTLGVQTSESLAIRIGQ